MTFDARQPAAPEIALRPAPGLAALVAVLVVLATGAIVVSGIALVWAALLVVGALVYGARAVLGLLKPGLVLRLDGERLRYRRDRGWSSLVRQPFVSPWFIGWRGEGLAGYGVVAGQLAKNDFRRLARSLRLSGSPLSE
ncbi:MAG: hypothetical protein ACOCVP_07995 [Wenzhouxiangella sp.]